MRPILFVRNDSFETFGLARAAVEAAGAPVTVCEAIDGATPPPLDDVSGVVVFGSSFNIEQADDQPFIKDVAALSRECVDRDVPLLGVCFGAQLLAWAFDAEIGKAPEREVGFEPIRTLPAAADDPMVSHYADGDRVFQWHMDTFTLPPGAELLVTSDRVPHQAFRMGDAAWGIQFHFEIDDPELELWLEEFGKLGDLETEWGKASGRVRDEARAYLPGHERKGREVFRRFSELCRERRG